MDESLSLGQAIYLAVKPIMKVYLVMFVGFISVKLDLMSMETSRGISNTLVNLILPCLTFNKIVKNLSGSKIKLIGVIIMSGIVIFGVGGLLAFLMGLALPGIPKKWRYGFIFAGIFCNISDLPIAYVQSLGSGIVFKLDEVDEGCTISVIFLVVQQLLLMNCGVFQVVGLDFRDYEGDDEKEVDTVESSGSSVSTEAKAVGTSSSSDLSATEKSDLRNSIESESTKGNNNNTAIARAQLSRTNINVSHESFYSARSAARMAHHPQDRETVINEYSEAGALRQQHNNIEELARTISLRQEIGLNRDAIDEVIETDEGGVIVIEHKHEPTKFDLFFERHKLGWLKYLIVNFKRIPSIVVLIALTIAMIPWIRCLFVKNSIHIKEAPDHQPVLSVIMDFTDYVGQAAVPLGVILLGGMIARLNVGTFNWKFLFSACCFTAMRLVLMPVLGVLYVKGLAKSNLISTNIEKFVLILSCSVPSATAQVYFTAFYTPLIGDHVQMDCLAVLLMIQYPVLLLTLPTVMTYVLKVHLGL